jgi:hypothetical protein
MRLSHPHRTVWLRLLASLFLLAFFTSALPGGAGEKGDKGKKEELDLAKVPMDVSAALEKAPKTYKKPLEGAKWTTVYKLEGTKHPIYQFIGKNGRGNKIETEITDAGRVIEVEEHGVPLSEVPKAVVDALKAKMPDFKIDVVEAIYQNELADPVSYGFETKATNATKKIEVYISADGKKFLNK